MGQANDRRDAVRLEGILANSGDLDLVVSDGPTGHWGPALDRALRSYQKRWRLTVDGWLRPGGPTLALMAATMARVLEGFAVPSPEEIDWHHSALAAGKPPRIAIVPQIEMTPIPGLPDLSAGDRAANAAQVDWMLKKWSGLGGVPAQFAHYVVRRGRLGIAQARDFVEQYSARRPHDADILVYSILRALPDSESRERFLGGTPGGYRPAGTRLVRP
ncbi:MAG: peptidoglycan-binding protein [Rhodospirillales bacterium]|nr:peptidoglycan-binding protein [Rhodospirillales bacterium]